MLSTRTCTRRNFVAAGAALAAVAGLGVSGLAFADAAKTADSKDAAASDAKATEAAEEDTATRGTVTYTVDMTQYAEGTPVRLWLPVASDGDYQTITDVTFDAPGANFAEITEDDLGNQMLAVVWDADAKAADRTATCSFHVERQAVTCPELVEEGEPGDDVAEYLEGSSMVPLNDQVIEAAEEICEGQDTYLGKARAIYDWIIANMNRDESVTGCGTGDVCALLSSRSGKCTDISSVFIGLCRAVGVPARETFGIRMNADDITKNQHCWSEFYLPGTGWVCADPADVLKAVLKNDWSKDSDECREKAEFYWGNLESERVGLSAGRDITLNPAQSDGALNNFGYPYAEVGGDAVDYYDPENFVYSIAFVADEA